MRLLTSAAIEAAGLGEIARARREGAIGAPPSARKMLEEADLLAVGALADEIRESEVGVEVRVFAVSSREERRHGEAFKDVILVKPRETGAAEAGLLFLRDIAISRITGPRAARIQIDAQECGKALLQVALGFGASEVLFVNQLLRLSDDRRMSEAELLTLIERTGRHPNLATTRAVHMELL